MEYIKFTLENARYYLNVASTPRMSILANFLESDYGSGRSSFKEWTNNEEYKFIEGNISWLEKENDDVIITYLFDRSEDIYEHAFRTSKKQFLELLNKWEKLYKEGPKEIIITYEDGKIHLEGINDIN